jgi:hypothetical protein
MRAIIYFKNQIAPKAIKEREVSLKLLQSLNQKNILGRPKKVSDHVAVIIGRILNKHASLEE